MGKLDKAKLKEKITSLVSTKCKPFIDKLRTDPKFVIRMVVVVVIVYISFSSIFMYYKLKWHKIIKASGVIEGDDVRLSFRVKGQIEELLVDEGYLLEIGQLLARLDKENLIEERAEAEATLVKAERQLALDDLDYLRAENLFEQGAISEQARDSAKTKAGTTGASVDEARASLELAQTRFDWGDLISPMVGYVITKSSLQGEVVQIGEPVFTVIDLRDIWVTAYILESDLGKVKYGQKAYVKTDSYPLKKYDAWVSFISQQTEFTPKYIQTTTERVKYVYRIKVRVDNSSLDLKPGMPADAYIIED